MTKRCVKCFLMGEDAEIEPRNLLEYSRRNECEDPHHVNTQSEPINTNQSNITDHAGLTS